MSDIPRWTAFSHSISEYEYWHANAPDVVIVVTYADHVAAVAAARTDARTAAARDLRVWIHNDYPVIKGWADIYVEAAYDVVEGKP
jgi:hypothetical protein